jgi:hypothetical protein
VNTPPHLVALPSIPRARLVTVLLLIVIGYVAGGALLIRGRTPHSRMAPADPAVAQLSGPKVAR